jgi:hypothetical protein
LRIADRDAGVAATYHADVTTSERFSRAIARIDAANAPDPNGKELAYSQRMTDWLARLAPGASEPLRLAARAQHIMRWKIPRSEYPMDRAGYHRWRTRLYDFHADAAADILRDVGYDEQAIARVRSLIRKERIKSDPEMQTLEDVICLVFLENYFHEFAQDHDEQKLINILQRTWKKMSPRGHELALQLPLNEKDRRIIEKALSGPSPGTPGEAG